MRRTAIEDLYRWKESRHRKPLIIRGARQVGKTRLMKEFGDQAYESTVYINPFSVRASMADVRRQDGLINLPLYAVGEIDAVVNA